MSAAKRHPARAWRPDLERCARVLAEQLEHEGARWPEYAAAALVARGSVGMSLHQWARRLDVSSELVASAEAGALSPEEWPDQLWREIGARGCTDVAAARPSPE